MKRNKRIKRILLIIFLIIVIYIVFHNIVRGSDAKKHDGEYKYIALDQGDMHVYDSEIGSETLVFLSGFRTGSPIVDFMPLAKELEDEYRIIIIEYLGYGYSDVTDEDRTIENIASEIHETLNRLDVKEYYLLSHSISGIYSYYYCNEYTDEIKGIIGMESAIPKQLEGKQIPGATIGDILVEKSGAIRLASYFYRDLILPEDMDDYYSEFEQKELLKMTVRTYNNRNHLDEMNRYEENVDKAIDIELAENISILHIISPEVHSDPEEWISFHRNASENSNNGLLVILSGSHYLHREMPNELAEIIKDFIDEN
jgi:pimeloyl-ACP methyl ester carboxylesterase